MKLILHGVRGSRPTHKPNLARFGGNSTCAQFLIDGSDYYLFIDGGSGLAAAGRVMGETPTGKRFNFLITHTHWDHILGFPFFLPMYSAQNDFTFHASDTSQSTFKKLFYGLSQADNLPIPGHELRAKVKFKSITPETPFSIEEQVRIGTYQLNHQGVTLGYRLEHGTASACFITDNAPIAGGNYLGEGMKERAKADPAGFEKRFNDGLVAFMRNAHTVVFDTHFNDMNLKPDWGHSTPSLALDFCIKAAVKRLIIFHHAPEESDEDVDQKVASVRDRGARHGVEVVAAVEGKIWDLS